MPIADRQRPPPGELYLDHVSHFVPDLGQAGELLEALGFAVTPLSAQVTQDGAAGTSNRCVMLAEGYLEFLTPTMDTPNAARMRNPGVVGTREATERIADGVLVRVDGDAGEVTVLG